MINKNQFEGKLNQLKGDAKIWWGKTTNDLGTELEGNADKLKGSLQEQQGDLESKFNKAMAKYEEAKQAFETRKEEINNEIKTKWEKITNDDVEDINGSFETFAEKLKEKYNKTQEEANAQIQEFMAKFK